MKSPLSILVLALVLILANSERVHAQSTNTLYWVQNVGFALTAEVQTGNAAAAKAALPTKEIIRLLSNISISVANSSTNTVITTNTLNVASNATLPGSPFPSTFVASNSYVVTIGASSFTNHADFTNDVTMTQVTNNPVTYTFNNAVVVGTSGTTVIFSGLPASTIQAVLVSSNEPAYALTGFTTNTSVSNVTSTVTTPTFSPAAKLLIANALSGEAPTRWLVRDGKKPVVDTDVSAFFSINDIKVVSQALARGSTEYDHFEFSFNNRKDTAFSLNCLGKQQNTVLLSGGQALGGVIKSFNSDNVGSGTLNGQPAVMGGKFRISGGKVE